MENSVRIALLDLFASEDDTGCMRGRTTVSFSKVNRLRYLAGVPEKYDPHLLSTEELQQSGWEGIEQPS